MNMNGLAGWVAVNVVRVGGMTSVMEVVAVVLAMVLDASRVESPDTATDEDAGMNTNVGLGANTGAASKDLAETNAASAEGSGAEAGLADVEGVALADHMTAESTGFAAGADGCLTPAICN